MRMYIIFVLELRICLKIKTATAITLVNLVEPFQGFNLTFNLRSHHPLEVPIHNFLHLANNEE